MPAMFGAMLCLFLWGMAPVFWLFALPVFPILVFMVSLAEVHDEGEQIRVKMWWKFTHIPKRDILSTGNSFLDGIGVLRLRRFMFPWGRIYFVHEWSTIPLQGSRDL
jgi:hypothetical protein